MRCWSASPNTAKPELSLQFADADASVFAELLESPLGGSVPADNVLLLTDEKATTAAVRNGFQDFLKRRAGKNDTVVILIAGHGTVDGKNAYHPHLRFRSAGFEEHGAGMDELQSLFEEQLTKVGRVLLFVDVCKAGTIGTIHNTTVASNVQQLGDIQGDLFGLLASRPREVSLEGPEFGGGHGVFSYFVIKGLEGAADAEQRRRGGCRRADQIRQRSGSHGDREQTASARVRHLRQHDAAFGHRKQARHQTLAHWRVILDSRNGGPLYLAGAPQGRFRCGIAADDGGSLHVGASMRAGSCPAIRTTLSRLSRDLKGGTSRPNNIRSARTSFEWLSKTRRRRCCCAIWRATRRRNRAMNFRAGARYMDAARTLTQESLFLEGRQDFFQGRALLFDKKFPEAANLLEQAVRIDPGAAYGFNALGIAYLEQAQYDKAIPAFRDAVRRAQHWSYPLHNEALAYVETGDYRIGHPRLSGSHPADAAV